MRTIDLMRKRLGFYQPPMSQEAEGNSSGRDNNLMRLRAGGGNFQQQRMIFDKRRSLDRALWNSYQGADIIHLNPSEGECAVRALINPNKLKQDYDDKIISVHYEDGYKPGDIFEWLGTDTYWIIYLQNLTELAYFRGDIRRCSYQIRWYDENKEIQSTYAALRGPQETNIEDFQKSGLTIDTPNHSLNFLIPKNKDTLAFFKRYARFYITNLSEEYSPEACWRVEAIDGISTPGILEVSAVEYYQNKDEDNIPEYIANVPDPDPIDPNPQGLTIEGETFIRPKVSYTYTCNGGSGWSIDDKYPVAIVEEDNESITLRWENLYSGQFELTNGDVTKIIVVESLF